jgi:hypothetical protein
LKKRKVVYRRYNNMNVRIDIAVLFFILLTYALGLDVENVQLELLFFIACHVAIISHKKK